MTSRDDYDSLRQGCGLARRPVELLALTGADRERFLNAKVTCEISGLSPGLGAYGFFTNHQGKVLSDAVVRVEADRLLLELPASHAAAIADHLRKYLLADRVEVAAAGEQVPLTLLGPGAGAVVESLVESLVSEAGLTATIAGTWGHRRAVLATGEEILLARQDHLGVAAWTLWAPADVADRLAERLLAPGAANEVRAVGPEALETVRAEAGLPRFGQDYGSDNFPQESGLEAAAVSYTKGCYLGQEVVARIHYRGGVHKGLAGLVFEGDGAESRAGSGLLYEDKEVGTVTTAVDSPALGRPIGLAVIQLRAAQPGTRLEVRRTDGTAGGGQAEVHPLPFVPAA